MVFLYNKNYQRNIKAQLNFYKETARKTREDINLKRRKVCITLMNIRQTETDMRLCSTIAAEKSGLKLPVVSLGLWHNFGSKDNYDMMKTLCFTAFDNGITHFDLANNYGPIYGSAEENFGRIMRDFLRPYRNELIISTKAGYDMWDGPYGNWGSRKYLIASLDESLKRMQLDYVDIFYHHRMDPETPLEETILALDQIVRSGKALVCRNFQL